MNASQKFAIVKKLSVKAIHGKVSVRDIPQGGEQVIGTFFGRAVGHKTITTDKGDSLAFSGDFRAINAAGARFASMTMYLPNEAAGYLAAQIKSGEAVEFAFKVSVADNPDSPVGYEYRCEPLQVAEGQGDPLGHLVKAITGETPAPAALPDKSKGGNPNKRKSK